ncbi:MAG TPA: metallophosphoesterase [Polyangiaceae bacterium LLY-WYZ-15_(1-7)]|nr:metallophosphoesterase [Polyangiaceae bacterium LLY-WYZ-15_(1-7)]HJL09372.1 metallophosphoesterase [Polyangiaceae bacterium LLY-WYZ-15_(1-7)]HJL22632.1 metallophosphoesterase [Polyangiaceae bacterium LLY-WYZ-15_(1-7)]HJL29513.1 metallophosphoesterase [Polyangiaceae bacterium LLY-WYZ-15_(1-7)]HJL38995.1 metallophosphoesterase [Polyangiaceae bacterium LLY-WYZ-15_(1-7)]
MSLLRLLLLFAVATGGWTAAHWYVSRRLFRPWALPGPTPSDRRQRLARVAFWLAWALVPLTMLLGRSLTRAPWFAPIRWAGFVHMGLFFLVFCGVFVRDLGFAGAKLATRLSRGDPDLGRRAFLTRTTNAGILGGAGVLTAWGFVEARALPTVVEVDVPITGLPPALDGYRIAQLSDIHVGPTIRGAYLAACVRMANELEPDLIAVTGDLVDGYVDDLRDDVAPLGELAAPDGVYFCTGNHEYYWDAEAWVAEVERLGLTALCNAHRLVEREGAKLLVAGCTDYRADRLLPAHASDPAKAKEGAPAHDVSLLLAHQPRSLEAAAAAGFDLQLSGHTHGGQFFPVNLFIGLAQPVGAGLAKRGDLWVYVNRGTGYWGPPQRAGVPSEITLLRLVRA